MRPLEGEYSMAELSGRGRYAAVMGLIGSGHALSHFYVLALPALFPLLKQEFGVGYLELGLLITLFNVVTGVLQLPAGILVDRFGARILLGAGLAILGLSFAGIALATSYWMVAVLICVAGIGGSIFHPADYAIITASVEESRMGRAFSLHTFTGSLGIMAAPGTILLLTAIMGWRGALLSTALLSVAVLGCLIVFGNVLREQRSAGQSEEESPAGVTSSTALLLSAPVLTMFAFWVFVAMVGGGMQTFAVTTLVAAKQIGLETAGVLLTVFLVASATGVLLGGPLADRTKRHGLTAALAMIGSAVLILIVAGFSLPAVAIGLAFALFGLMQGSIRPARDMMMRAVTPPGATGRVFGFVSTGYNVGNAAIPVILGWLIDIGQAEMVFYLLAAIMIVAIATVGVARRPASNPAAAE